MTVKSNPTAVNKRTVQHYYFSKI